MRATERYFLLLALVFNTIPGFAQLTTTPGTSLSIAIATKVGVKANLINGGTITNTGTLYLFNNWTNNATYSGLGIVNLSGSDQFFSHNGEELATLFVNGVGNKQISTDVKINEGLVLNSGYLDISPSANFLVRSTASISGASSASYVRGKMQVSGLGNHYFPIGTSSNFAPVELINVKGNAPVVALEVKEPHPAAQSGLGIVEVSQARYWEKTMVAGEMTEGSITLPAINESFIGSINNASVVASNELGGVYESLGQQSTSGTVDNGTVTSFEDALFSFYALASEINNSRAADSIALVKIYTRANGDNWLNKTNWLTGSIDTWQGVSVQAGRVVGVNLAGNNLTGRLTADLRKLSAAASLNFSNNQLGQGVPASITQLSNLQTFNLSSNQLQDLPDVSSLSGIQLLDVSSNSLEFDDLEPNLSIPNFNYANQGRFGVTLDSLQKVHLPFIHSLSVGGSANQYQWFLNGSAVAGATNAVYPIADLNYDNMGAYELRATSSVVPDLILSSNTQRIRATASVQGRILDTDGANVASALVGVLGIKAASRYDSLPGNTAGVNGAFFIPQLVLGDYLLYASQNGAVYIPSYYKGTIDWVFADVIGLRDNIAGVNIAMERVPRELTTEDGDNTFSGLFESDFDQGRVLERKRVGGAGVSVSRSRIRAKDNDEDYELVAYVQTDENGEFEINNLADGDYRLNIQYPGIPMDPNSFIDFQLGGGAGVEQNSIRVNAFADNNSIVVTKVEETGIYLDYFKGLTVYPNPADKYLTIRYDKLVKGKVVASLIDLTGQVLLTTPLQTGNEVGIALDISHLENGMYVLRFVDLALSSAQITSYKILIEREL